MFAPQGGRDGGTERRRVTYVVECYWTWWGQRLIKWVIISANQWECLRCGENNQQNAYLRDELYYFYYYCKTTLMLAAHGAHICCIPSRAVDNNNFHHHLICKPYSQLIPLMIFQEIVEKNYHYLLEPRMMSVRMMFCFNQSTKCKIRLCIKINI